MPTLHRLLLTACLLAPCAPLAFAQAPAGPAPATAAPGAASATAPPTPDPAASAAPAEGDAAPAPATNAAGNSGNVRRLKAGGEEFSVHVAPITGGPAQGTLVLVPGDAAFAMSSRGIAQLRDGMPAFGWSAWVPELESPPRSHAAALGRKSADPSPAEGAQAATVPEDVPLEAARAGELQAWATRNRARLAAVVTAAATEGRVVVVAEGVGAALLTGLVAEAPHAAFAVALVEPVELPGLPAAWPKGSATPVLEVFDPAAQHTQGAARRSQANASGLHYYRQTVLSLEAGGGTEGETLLVRRLRGWLRSLEPADAPPAGH